MKSDVHWLYIQWETVRPRDHGEEDWGTTGHPWWAIARLAIVVVVVLVMVVV